MSVEADQDREAEAYEALGNAIASYIEAGLSLTDFRRDASDIWPDIVEVCASHIVDEALTEARAR